MKLSNISISIKYKYMLFSALVVIVVSSAVTLIAIKIVSDYVISNTVEHLSKTLNYYNSVLIEDLKNRSLEICETISGDARITGFIENNDRSNLNKEFRICFKFKKFDVFFIYKNKSFLLSGTENTGQKNFFQSIIERKMTGDKKVFIDGDDKLGLFVLSIVPVKNSRNKEIAKILTGFDLSKSEFTDHIRNNLDMDVSIFYKSLRINTTLTKNGIKQTGTHAEPHIADVVLKQNRLFTGNADVLGMPHVTAYMPLSGSDGSPVGMIGLGTSRADIDKVLIRIIISIALFTFLAVSMLFVVSYIYITRMISGPISLVSKSLMKISRRELNISGINFKRIIQDEISDLSHSLNSMVDAIKNYESKLEYAAFYDSMTNLPNKRMLFKNYSCIKYFQHGEIHCDNSDTGCKCFIAEDRLGVVLYLNTGNLKNVNDVFGHTTGDMLLIETGIRLKQIILIHGGEIFRLGGDEFIICNKKLENRDRIIKMADEIIRCMQTPFNIRGNVINVSISIGISLCPQNGININELLKNADIAMNKAREKGGNTYVFYNETMKIELQKRVEMELALKKSIINNEFELYFQPKYNIKNEKIEGFEALIRWEITKGGFISPDIFIPLAEQTGCIIQLGEWIMKKSFQIIRQVNLVNGNNYVISINVSVAQIMQDNFLSGVNSILYEYDIDPEFIEFEITESVLIESFDIVKEKLHILKNAGFGLALDDFGKGYSSLSYLKMLPLTTLKLDKTFIDDIKNPEMIEDIIRIAHRMGLRIIAEGVESREQFELLHSFNCDAIQGYYISTPLPEHKLFEILDQNHSKQ